MFKGVLFFCQFFLFCTNQIKGKPYNWRKARENARKKTIDRQRREGSDTLVVRGSSLKDIGFREWKNKFLTRYAFFNFNSVSSLMKEKQFR